MSAKSSAPNGAVLVTGSNGFLGSALMRRLVELKTPNLVAFVRPGSDRSRLNTLLAEHPGSFRVLTGGLSTQAEARAALHGVGTVYHLAASLNGAPADVYLNTVVTSKHLLDAVTELPSPPKIVLVSSFGVYGVATLPRGAVVNEQTPLEAQPERRDLYSQAKLRQEQLFWEYRARRDYPLVVLRPGAIYGPSGSAFSARVGVQLPGVFLFLGRDNLLPLSYVDNCADALVVCGTREEAVGQIYNVHDDDLPTCREYLAAYKRHVGALRALPVPFPLLLLGSHLVERYHRYSRGQLPAIFTPYKSRTTWQGNRFDNSKLKGLGWSQRVPTEQALLRAFQDQKQRRAREAA